MRRPMEAEEELDEDALFAKNPKDAAAVLRQLQREVRALAPCRSGRFKLCG